MGFPYVVDLGFWNDVNVDDDNGDALTITKCIGYRRRFCAKFNGSMLKRAVWPGRT